MPIVQEPQPQKPVPSSVPPREVLGSPKEREWRESERQRQEQEIIQQQEQEEAGQPPSGPMIQGAYNIAKSKWLATPEGQVWSQSQLESIQYYKSIGHPEFGGRYAPLQIPEGYVVKNVRETSSGLSFELQLWIVPKAQQAFLHLANIREERNLAYQAGYKERLAFWLTSIQSLIGKPSHGQPLPNAVELARNYNIPKVPKGMEVSNVVVGKNTVTVSFQYKPIMGGTAVPADPFSLYEHAKAGFAADLQKIGLPSLSREMQLSEAKYARAYNRMGISSPMRSLSTEFVASWEGVYRSDVPMPKDVEGWVGYGFGLATQAYVSGVVFGEVSSAVWEKTGGKFISGVKESRYFQRGQDWLGEHWGWYAEKLNKGVQGTNVVFEPEASDLFNPQGKGHIPKVDTSPMPRDYLAAIDYGEKGNPALSLASKEAPSLAPLYDTQTVPKEIVDITNTGALSFDNTRLTNLQRAVRADLGERGFLAIYGKESEAITRATTELPKEFPTNLSALKAESLAWKFGQTPRTALDPISELITKPSLFDMPYVPLADLSRTPETVGMTATAFASSFPLFKPLQNQPLKPSMLTRDLSLSRLKDFSTPDVKSSQMPSVITMLAGLQESVQLQDTMQIQKQDQLRIQQETQQQRQRNLYAPRLYRPYQDEFPRARKRKGKKPSSDLFGMYGYTRPLASAEKVLSMVGVSSKRRKHR